MYLQTIVDGKVIPTTLTRFSDGALNLKIDFDGLNNAKRYVCFTISPQLSVTDAIYITSLAEAILDENVTFQVKVILNIPYFPQARADRIFEGGMTNPVELFTKDLRKGTWDEIITRDVHSRKVLTSISDRLTEIDQRSCFLETMNKNHTLRNLVEKGAVFCAPDKGASTKVESVAKGFSPHIVQMDKVRDVTTGHIHGIEIVSGCVINQDILIVDDICDGGMTFLKAAEELKHNGANSVSLYVTHGIFSKGVDIFKGVIDNIFTNQLVMSHTTEQQVNEFNGDVQ